MEENYVNIYKILEIVIPKTMLINANIENNYRYHMSKMKWLQKMTHMAIEDPFNSKNVATVMPLHDLPDDFNQHKFSMIIQHFKLGNKQFDSQNYVDTIKIPTDVLTHSGYWEDDNHHVLNPFILISGDSTNWKENNQFGLEDEIYEVDNLEDYFKKVVPKYLMDDKLNNKKKPKNQLTKLSDFDIFQIWVYSV